MESVDTLSSAAVDDTDFYPQQPVDYFAILKSIDTVNQHQSQQSTSISTLESSFYSLAHVEDSLFGSRMEGSDFTSTSSTYSDWFGMAGPDSFNCDFETTAAEEQTSQKEGFSMPYSLSGALLYYTCIEWSGNSFKSAQTSHASDCSCSSPSGKSKSSRVTTTKSADSRISKKIKVSHNVIEKRYRNRINDKLSALRDCIPTFSTELNMSDKVKKGVILEKATEYIRHLETRNHQLMEEVALLKRCLDGVPNKEPSSFSKGLVSKTLMASMAGLMFLGSAADEDSGTHGLAAIPGGIYLSKARNSIPTVAPRFTFLLKLSLLMFVFISIVLPRVFKSAKKEPVAQRVFPVTNLGGWVPEAPPNITSVRTSHQKAFETAMQSVWVPHVSYFCLVVLLTMRVLRAGLRMLIGTDGYRLLTNTSEAGDLTRQAAWGLAIDSQLLGGDKTINRARLCLTFMASLMLPVNTLRLMTNAIHFRVLVVGVLPEKIAAFISSYFWNRAKIIQEQKSSEPIPPHLQRLLEVHPDELFSEETVARMHSLAFFGDTVLNDSGVRSPLDALSVSFVHKYAVAALNSSFGNTDHKDSRYEEYMDVIPPHTDFQHWVVLLRALLHPDEGTLLYLLNFWQNGSMALQVPETKSVPKFTKESIFRINDDICVAVRCAILLGLLSKSNGMEHSIRKLLLSSGWVTSALQHKNTPLLLDRLGPLGMISLWRVFYYIVVQKRIKSADQTERVLENVAAVLRVWIGNEKQSGLDIQKRLQVARECIRFCKQVNGFEGSER